MTTLVYRSDVHMSDKPPANRMDDWTMTVLDKLRQVGEIAREVRASAVLDNGDFFHVKSPSRTAHETNRLVAEVHNDYPCPVYGNVGNHDVVHGDIKNLPKAPLGMLFESGVFRRCYDEFEAMFESHFADATTPPGGIFTKVRVVGIPYHGTKYDWDRFTSIKKGDEDYLVVIAHVLASPGGGTMFEAEDVIQYKDLAPLDPDVYCFGHWHRNQGIQEIVPGKHVVNIGSLTRGALTQDEMTRIPSVAIMEFTKDGITLSQRELKVAPAENVFNVSGRVRSEARTMTIDSFIEQFRVSLIEMDDDKPLEEQVMEADAPEEVRERTVSFLEKQGDT